MYWQDRPGVSYEVSGARKGKSACDLSGAGDKSWRAGLVGVLHLNFAFEQYVQVLQRITFTAEGPTRSDSNVLHALREPSEVFFG